MSTAAANGQPSNSAKTSDTASKGLKRPRITVLGGGVIGLSAATVRALAHAVTRVIHQA
jgi:predicted NAD/FAD-binding protein